MAVREPAWFKPELFSKEVLFYCFRKIGVIPPETAENLNQQKEKFIEAVRIVGKAVFALQVIIHDRLRELFIHSINAVAGVEDGQIYAEILEFMTQGYLQNDIFNLTLSSFAVIVELVLFMDDFGFPIPPFWYHMPWCAIYEHRLKREISSNGGWETLLHQARIRYADLYDEILISLRSNSPPPYVEESDLNNWPLNPRVFIHERFGVAPRSTTLAMGILRKLYTHEQQMVPVPGAGARAIRIMLGLPIPPGNRA